MILVSTHLRTNDSNTFAAVGVSDMGRISLSMDCGGRFLVKGTAIADFHIPGNTPSGRELLYIAAGGFHVRH